MAAGTGWPERAARLLGAAETIREAIGALLPPAERPVHAAATLASRQALGEPAFAVAWSAGQQLDVDTAVSLVLDTPAPHNSPPQP